MADVEDLYAGWKPGRVVKSEVGWNRNFRNLRNFRAVSRVHSQGQGFEGTTVPVLRAGTDSEISAMLPRLLRYLQCAANS